MARNELTGIERQLVLDYLTDGNVPLSVTYADGVEFVQSEQDLISLKNIPGSYSNFSGRCVRVQFYFNKLSLYFYTKFLSLSSGLFMIRPAVIKKVEDRIQVSDEGFSVTLCYNSARTKSSLPHKTDVVCDFDSRFPLFIADDYIKRCNTFLMEKTKTEEESIQGRVHAPKVIYLDSKQIVFAYDKKDMFFSYGGEYVLNFRFPISESGPLRSRNVELTCLVDQMIENYDRNKLCAIANYSSIKAEDARFIYDKISSSPI